MDNTYIMGYKVNRNIKFFRPETVLFSKGQERITVKMANDFLNYILGILARKNPLIDSYKKAKKVFSAFKMVFDNKQPPRLSKEDMKTAIDVLEEIKNMSANSDAEKEYNARCALVCKLLINSLCVDYRE